MIRITPDDAVFAESLLNKKALWIRSKGIWTVYVNGFGEVAKGENITATAIAARRRLLYLIRLNSGKRPEQRYIFASGSKNPLETANGTRRIRLFSARIIRHKEAGR